MNTLFTILTVLIIIASILLVIVVLLQNSKGGMASNFGVGNQAFGVRQTVQVLEKITWGLVSFILVASVISTFTFSTGKTSSTPAVNSNDIKVEAPAQPAEFPSPAQEVPATPAQ